MSVQYHILYWLRFKPWDTGVVGKDLAEMVEGPEALPPGRALDLGCGTGTQAVYLAQHGWQVTGVDIVPRALAEASRKVSLDKSFFPTLPQQVNTYGN